MSDHVDTMAYAGEVPWHGLGTQVDDNLTPDQMLVAAGLDWTVEKKPLYYPVPNENGDKPKLRLMPGKEVLIRNDRGTVLDIVGDNWNPVQNHDVFDFFKKFVKAGDMKMETAGSLKGGQFVWALAKFDGSVTIPGSNDRTEGYMLLSSPHKFGYSLIGCPTAVRVVCWNTLSAAVGVNSQGKLGGRKKQTSDGNNTTEFRMWHSNAFDMDMRALAEKQLGLAQENLKAYGEAAHLLSETPISDKEVVDYFHDLLRLHRVTAAPDEELEVESRRVNRLLDVLDDAPGQELKTTRGTLWGAVNAVTYEVDHLIGRNDDNRLASAWYGVGKSLKERAFALAMDRALAA